MVVPICGNFDCINEIRVKIISIVNIIHYNFYYQIINLAKHSVNFGEYLNSFIMKSLVIATLAYLFMLSLSACSSNTEICSCLESGKKLEKFSSELLQREATAKDLQKMKKLKSDQEKKCTDFQTMDGAKMLELKEACGE
jgi:hypothetical protein